MNGVVVLEITLAHVLALDTLPAAHRDPFDRLLVAQANAEGAALLSRDPIFRHYPVPVLW
jgi:PIN domain nuclease of toxin-antitoxin system